MSQPVTSVIILLRLTDVGPIYAYNYRRIRALVTRYLDYRIVAFGLKIKTHCSLNNSILYYNI
jgi:hypothetical protein